VAFSIQILPSKRIITCDEGESLKEVLNRNGIQFLNDCGGEGVCGSCKVLYQGESDFRLACQQAVSQDIALIIPEASGSTLLKRITDLKVAPCAESGYGIACDLGTSILAFYLVSKAEGRILAQYSVLNPQLAKGGDVITRLEYAKSDEGRSELHRLIIEALAQGVDYLLSAHGIGKTEITHLSVAGNSAMTHFLLGKAGEGLERAPYISPLQGKGFLHFAPALVGLNHDCECVVFPILGGFIGGDTTAGIVAANLDFAKETQALIDFGTNGEIVLAYKGTLWATSTAAGPAFEGVGMACGMPALNGAIEAISPQGELQVIGESVPNGFCGSGYISTIAYLLNKGIIASNGLLRENSSHLRRWSPLDDGSEPAIVQDDIRKFQLAKSAIASGLEIICREVRITTEEIHRLFITGSFGNRIDPASAIAVGLLPNLPGERIAFIDNGAGRGAILYILDRNIHKRILRLQNRIVTLNLGEREDFQERFVNNLRF
jgi:uncharacterized 2Fe-2S/4Fe-4S cluster protein (DUF4445 family)